ncbi:MAG: solute carrier family 23 protein [Liquorilactobacillus hordei]|uniref:Xanthine/uracil permease n=1 Tax=Liquorilactobacillus hordei TaxID=468911 RepID=A0A3S6QQL7_9LACO|nr:solute carrier family 23 protein [Liquorilactobacillus hordei]AUJ30308.1 xanthine/uracil permease [Liquorilactobacillus hordei]MBZ2405630.1 xanthine/uracil permease [Liquorilactobacillus hordei]
MAKASEIRSSNLSIGVDEKISWQQSLILGLQHVLAMDVYVPPVIIASAVAMSATNSAALIQSTFLGAGIASLIQVLFFLKLPVCQGPSFVPIGALVGIIVSDGGKLDTAMGATLVGAIAITLLGLTGIYKYIVKHFIPSIVSGTIIMIVGLTLLPTAFTSNIYISTKTLSMDQNVLLAFITAAIMILFSMLGVYFSKIGRVFRISSVIIALACGSFVASLMGGLDLSSVASAPFFSLPHIAFINYGISFNWSAILTMLVIYMVLLAETTGTWFAVSAVIEEPLKDEQVNRGVIGEGIGCFIASLVGATPLTGYSTNAGIISITGVASRRVFVGASIFFIALSFLGKLSALINAIPSAVIGGVFAVVCMVIMLSGFRVIKNEEFSERELYIIGVPLIFAIGLLFMPSSLSKNAPQLLKYLLDSPIAISAIVAIIMNKLIPAK